MADQRILYTEEMVGANHPTKADTLNRLALAEHNSDGTHKAGALPLLQTQQAMSGTSVTLSGIPSGANMVVIALEAVSLDTSDYFHVQLGDSSGIEATGYVANGARLPNGGAINITNETSGFPIKTAAGGDAVRGVMTLVRMSGNLWVASFSGYIGSTATGNGGGEKTLSGELTQILIGRTGTGQFDAGNVNLAVF